MEKEEKIECLERLFAVLVRRTLWKDFRLTRGGKAKRVVKACADELERRFGNLSAERMADFCVCQVYVMSRFDASYRRKWNITHSFGAKAVERYAAVTPVRRRYEDRWLKEHGISREALVQLAGGSREHPYRRFIYPEYEEVTKRRLLSSEAGFAVCRLSTLLWTPFSPSCRKCANAERCRRLTGYRFAELYRIRVEAWKEKEAEA